MSGTLPEATDEKQSKQMISLALKNETKLFRDDDDVPYATFKAGNHRETVRIGSRRFKQWLRGQFYATTKNPPQQQAVSDAIAQLESMAVFSAEPAKKVWLRTGNDSEGSIYIDLCNDAWEQIKVTKNGWRIIEESPVAMTRQSGMTALPKPERGGSLDLLWKYANAPTDELQKLFIAWMLAALRPVGPYPVLALQGGQGCGKSFTTKILRSIVDPSTAPLRTLPDKESDLLLAARNSHVQAYDNLSGLNPRSSDCLCRLSTGGGSSCRQLFTDVDEIIIDVKRPVILNGIDDIATRPDLQERCLICVLPTISDKSRLPEEATLARFEKDQPKIFGALLDVISGALKNLPDTELDALPRMADFALWIKAAEKGLGWETNSFGKVYKDNQDEAVYTGLQSDPFAMAVWRLSDIHPKGFDGTVTDALEKINRLASAHGANTDSKTWVNERTFVKRMRRLQGPLNAVGVLFDPGKHCSDGRRVSIKRTSSFRSPSSEKPQDKGLKADDSLTMSKKVTMLNLELPPDDEDDSSDDISSETDYSQLAF